MYNNSRTTTAIPAAQPPVATFVGKHTTGVFKFQNGLNSFHEIPPSLVGLDSAMAAREQINTILGNYHLSIKWHHGSLISFIGFQSLKGNGAEATWAIIEIPEWKLGLLSTDFQWEFI